MKKNDHWIIGIDRGGTFTDVVARSPKGELLSFKFLSEDPGRYEDAAIFALHNLFDLPVNTPLPENKIHSIRMGTTVATNALLERKGVPVCLVITKGFRDILAIGYQARPELFALNIRKPSQLYSSVIEIEERVDCHGEILHTPSPRMIEQQLQEVYDSGIRSLAIVLMNSYINNSHEKIIADIAQRIGFEQISVSSDVMRVQKIVARGDTTMVDAYLNPILKKYIRQVQNHTGKISLKFMKSNGGLTDANAFSAKDAIISGPAGGVIGYAHIAKFLEIEKVIGFDMGGTSTDVSRYDSGQCEKVYETETAGVRIQTPMINVVTVAAGGGSILDFDGIKLTVGPDSAGASPGPACYRNGGPLTVTDANLMLGRVIPKYFPEVFGPNHDQSLDKELVEQKFQERAREISSATGIEKSAEEVAFGYIQIANENMCKPIKEISVAKGLNVQEYTLMCFGGAGAQHACAIARRLGISKIILHPFAGVLSAYGMILADIIYEDARSVLMPFIPENIKDFMSITHEMENNLQEKVIAEGVSSKNINVIHYLDIRPIGSDTAETVIFNNYEECRYLFLQQYRQRYGFSPEQALEVVNIRIEVIGEEEKPGEKKVEIENRKITVDKAIEKHRVYFNGQWFNETPVFRRDNLQPGDELQGPAIIIETNSTVVIEPDFKVTVNPYNHLVLEKTAEISEKQKIKTDLDPVMLEIFNNLFMSIAEQMGRALQRTAHSVNIKERLDFSCALFDPSGGLVANAPHIPVHLGAMGDTVAYILAQNKNSMKSGDVFVSNNPYHGGSHLPDVTVVSPVFDENGELIFCVANRGHHADIGGITPGSMPAFSKLLEEEGIVIDNFKIVSQGKFDESGIRNILNSGAYPARNIKERLSDLRAQIAANVKGELELQRLIREYGLNVVQAYMIHVQNNAELAMRNAIRKIPDGVHEAVDFLDDGTKIQVKITIEGDQGKIDFSGTSGQIASNLNAPPAVTRSAILYVFRTLIEENVPLNSGCLKPLEVFIPEGTVLSPKPGAAVAGGNVETSQRVVDVLYKALKKVAASQGTMNNFTFGIEGYGYYETIAGGSGAGPGFDGADAVHTHMTNTRLTDPEVLEYRYPEVRILETSIRNSSGGEGHYYGGNGLRRKIQFFEPRTISILSERRKFQPYGINGGQPGSMGRNLLIKNDGRERILEGKVKIDVSSGDTICIETPGGGGYNLSQQELGKTPPEEMRRLIRLERWKAPTSGLCEDYAQMNLIVLEEKDACDFETFCRLNPKSCPLLEVLSPGNPVSQKLAPGADIRTELPRYWIYRNGKKVSEVFQISDLWQNNFVTFLIGCSFTFESALLKEKIPVRHIELGRNVPMYVTNIDCTPVGKFQGKMVVSMRPMIKVQAESAFDVTAQFPFVHGTPLCRDESDKNTMIINADELGINDISRPDFGDAVPANENEVPVFWACGVTSQMAAIHAKLDFFISHAPGHMFISDRKNDELKSWIY